MKGIIYKAENLDNGLVYIGATTDSVDSRRVDHIKKANNGGDSYFHEAISTFGEGVFNWSQIDTAASWDELAQKEKQFIIQYNSKEDGYNSDSGGGFKKSIYQYDIGNGCLIKRFNSLENAAIELNTSRQNISSACLSVNQIFGGYYWSYFKMERFLSKKDLRKKEVLQLDIMGHTLAKYISVSEASRQTGISKTCISRVCRKERFSSGGFRWNYS